LKKKKKYENRRSHWAPALGIIGNQGKVWPIRGAHKRRRKLETQRDFKAGTTVSVQLGLGAVGDLTEEMSNGHNKGKLPAQIGSSKIKKWIIAEV